MRIERPTYRIGRHAALRFWLWMVVAWLVIVTLLLAFGGHAGMPSPSDLGWTGLEHHSVVSQAWAPAAVEETRTARPIHGHKGRGHRLNRSRRRSAASTVLPSPGRMTLFAPATPLTSAAAVGRGPAPATQRSRTKEGSPDLLPEQAQVRASTVLPSPGRYEERQGRLFE